MCGRVVYCVVGQCTVWYGGIICGRLVYGVYCVVWRCTVR